MKNIFRHTDNYMDRAYQVPFVISAVNKTNKTILYNLPTPKRQDPKKNCYPQSTSQNMKQDL